MEIERKVDMVAIYWEHHDFDFELMFSFEPARWGLPLAFEHCAYGGQHHGYDCYNRAYTIRVLCAAVHFSADRSTRVIVSE